MSHIALPPIIVPDNHLRPSTSYPPSLNHPSFATATHRRAASSPFTFNNACTLPPVRQLIDVALADTRPQPLPLYNPPTTLDLLPEKDPFARTTLASLQHTSPTKLQAYHYRPGLDTASSDPFAVTLATFTPHTAVSPLHTQPRKRASTYSSSNPDRPPPLLHSASSASANTTASHATAATAFSTESSTASVDTHSTTPLLERSASGDWRHSPSNPHCEPLPPASSRDDWPSSTSSAPLPPGTFNCSYPDCTAASFQTQYLLNSHLNVHSHSRPHYCPIPACPRSAGGKGFKRKNEMIRHGLVHSSPGYVCPYCPRDREHRYPRPDNLQRHVRMHHCAGDLADPRLRTVLSQRPERGERDVKERRRRVD